MTLPPPCSTDEPVCFGSRADPFSPRFGRGFETSVAHLCISPNSDPAFWLLVLMSGLHLVKILLHFSSNCRLWYFHHYSMEVFWWLHCCFGGFLHGFHRYNSLISGCSYTSGFLIWDFIDPEGEIWFNIYIYIYLWLHNLRAVNLQLYQLFSWSVAKLLIPTVKSSR